ncbi:MAG TPA: ABC transporter permease [Firmicutes bacterium]|nr:ABC transporter permease [Bacillota bacterium]
MLFRRLAYFWGEAFRSFYRNFWVSLASIGVVVVTLLMFGTLVAINRNIDYITESVKKQVEIVVYIDDQSGLADRNVLRQQLAANPGLSEVRFVPKEEALERLKLQFGERGNYLEPYDSAEQNPLRDSYEVRTVVPEDVPGMARELQGYPGVGEVFYGQGYVETLFTTTRALQVAGLVLMAALAVTAIFLISHSIRLAVLLRRKEIMIMRYVGATNWFIRGPFILEGLILGVLGAVLPLVVFYYTYGAATGWVGTNLHFINMIPSSEIMGELTKLLLPLGIGLGVLGSMFSMGRYLRV